MHSSTRSGDGRKKAWERARVQGGSKHSLGRGRGVQGGTKAVPPFVGVSVHPGDTRMSRVERIIVLGSCGTVVGPRGQRSASLHLRLLGRRESEASGQGSLS